MKFELECHKHELGLTIRVFTTVDDDRLYVGEISVLNYIDEDPPIAGFRVMKRGQKKYSEPQTCSTLKMAKCLAYLKTEEMVEEFLREKK